jgi:hypothetical protein
MRPICPIASAAHSKRASDGFLKISVNAGMAGDPVFASARAAADWTIGLA